MYTVFLLKIKRSFDFLTTVLTCTGKLTQKLIQIFTCNIIEKERKIPNISKFKPTTVDKKDGDLTWARLSIIPTFIVVAKNVQSSGLYQKI